MLFLSLPCNCVAPRMQAALCLCPKTADLFKGMVNPPHFLLHRRNVFHLQPSLHRKKRCPQSLLCQTEENVRLRSCPSHKTEDGLWVTLQQIQPWACARERELRTRQKSITWIPAGTTYSVPPRPCLMNTSSIGTAHLAAPGLWTSHSVRSKCFCEKLMRNRFSGVSSIDLRNQLINFCNHN